MRPATSRLEVRKQFVSRLAVIAAGEHANGLSAAQALIDAAVSEACEDVCVPLADHWREGDTDELRCGCGEDVGECDSSCPVAALAEAGLIYVRVLPKCPTCTGESEHYGDCPADDGDEPERQPDTRDAL